MRFAYADPPYLGCCSKYDHYHPDGRCWDDLETHEFLIERLVDEFPDGWALSLHEPSLRKLLPMTPGGTRTMPWVKPFCAFKPNVNPAYAWEPVFVYGGRRRTRQQPTARDWVSANITLKKGLTGAKPEDFSMALFEWLNIREGDEFVDLFPGTGMVTDAYHKFLGRLPLEVSA